MDLKKQRKTVKYLIKWVGLYYDQCSWEDADDVSGLENFDEALVSYQRRMARERARPRVVRRPAAYSVCWAIHESRSDSNIYD